MKDNKFKFHNLEYFIKELFQFKKGNQPLILVVIIQQSGLSDWLHVELLNGKIYWPPDFGSQ
jgi:hypothetical protein